MQAFKEFVLFYVNNLYVVDFMLILLVFILFIFTLLLCVFLRHRPIIGLFIIALDIIASVFLFVYGYKFIDSEVRTRKIIITASKLVKSNGTFVIDFDLNNESKRDFKWCKITAKIYQNADNNASTLEAYKSLLLPARKKSVELSELKKSSTKSQRIAFENFANTPLAEGNFSVRLNSECF